MSVTAEAREPTPQIPAMRLLYWSVRRELWESRSIYIVPLLVAGLSLLGTVINGFTALRGVALLSPAVQEVALAKEYNRTPIFIMAISLLVAAFYCLGTLHGERRDRSILFWKSLPVSDLATVISKASIPIVVMPLFVFAIILATELIMLLLHTSFLLAYGGEAAGLWTEIPWFQKTVILLYSLIAFSLWYAPIYGWLLLISVWARRTPLLWAVLPPLILGIMEKLTFNTTTLGTLLHHRFQAIYPAAFTETAWTGDRLSELDPIKFLGSPGLWEGLAVAAAFLAAAIWLRRYRQPI